MEKFSIYYDFPFSQKILFLDSSERPCGEAQWRVKTVCQMISSETWDMAYHRITLSIPQRLENDPVQAVKEEDGITNGSNRRRHHWQGCGESARSKMAQRFAGLGAATSPWGQPGVTHGQHWHRNTIHVWINHNESHSILLSYQCLLNQRKCLDSTMWYCYVL